MVVDDGLQPTCDGLQPNSNGLQPDDGLQPTSVEFEDKENNCHKSRRNVVQLPCRNAKRWKDERHSQFIRKDGRRYSRLEAMALRLEAFATLEGHRKWVGGHHKLVEGLRKQVIVAFVLYLCF